MKALTGLPINYVVAVNFRGFTQIVSHVGGVWLDIDRRYYIPPNTGTCDHQPPARLPASERIAGARLRPLPPLRRRLSPHHAPAGVHARLPPAALEDVVQWTTSTSSTRSRRTSSVGNRSGGSIPLRTLLSYARLAQSLPSGNLIQVKLENVSNIPDGTSDTEVSRADLQNAIDQFANPDLTASARAASQNHVARAKKTAPAAPAPEKTSVLVLNASGTAGLARDTSYGLRSAATTSSSPRAAWRPTTPAPISWRLGRLLRPGSGRCQGRGDADGLLLRRQHCARDRPQDRAACERRHGGGGARPGVRRYAAADRARGRAADGASRRR